MIAQHDRLLLQDAEHWAPAIEIRGHGRVPFSHAGFWAWIRKQEVRARPRQGRGGGKEFYLPDLPLDIHIAVLSGRRISTEARDFALCERDWFHEGVRDGFLPGTAA